MGIAGFATRTVPKILDPLPGGSHLVDAIEFVVGWARANSLWPLVYGTACCAMEMMSTGSSRHDWARFGVEVARATPRQADLIVLAGTIVEKMGDRLVTLYEQMPGPKYVIAMGACSISGGPFYYDSYSVVRGGDRLIPVDVYVPGCPPRPEALLYGIMELQKKIRTEGRRNPWKIGRVRREPVMDLHSGARREWAASLAREEQASVATGRQRTVTGKTKPIRIKRERFAEVTRQERPLPGFATETIYEIVRREFPGAKPAGPDNMPAAGDPDQFFGAGAVFRVERGSYQGMVAFLKNHPRLRMNYLVMLTAEDRLEYFDLVVALLSTEHGHRVFLRLAVDRDRPEVGTISNLFAGAEWHEREVFDLFGITFVGHPDLRRLFLGDDFPGHPLRKDFDDPDRVVKRPY